MAVQAYDYEIEQKFSQLPGRKRYIPLKFSDYRIFAGEDDKEEDDASFEPDKKDFKEKGQKVPSGRGRGRPRKHPPPESKSDSSLQEGEVPKGQVIKVPSGYKCTICGRIFALRGNAKTHLITHTDVKPFPCDIEGCDKRLRTKESLRRHHMSHMGIKLFECPECKKKFSCNASLQEHMSLHTGEKPLSCEICGRSFRQIAVLKRHMTTHSDEKPFACSWCDKRFSMKCYVQSHMKTHTGEKPFSCDICTKTFAHASDLNRHKIIHSGKKPYACSVCSMRYSDPSSRRRHEREHLTSLLCPMCNTHFSRPGQMRMHLLREHNAEPEAMWLKQVVVKPDQELLTGDIKDASLFQVVDQLTTQNLSAEQMDGSEANSQAVRVNQIDSGTNTAQQELLNGQNMSVIVGEPSEVNIDPDSLQPQLMPGCVYKIIANDSENQVFELLLEEGADNFSVDEPANRVQMTDLQLDENTVTLIQQDNTFTIVQTPQDIATSQRAELQSELSDLVSSVSEKQPSSPPANAVYSELANESHKTLDVPISEGSAAIKCELGVKDTVEEIPCVGTFVALNEVQASAVETDISEVAEMPHVSLSDSDYVYKPDMNSQDYYNWLSAFSEECKGLTMPLESSKFKKISHIHKSLVDFMAMPSGVTADKNNFKVLLAIMKGLSDILSMHLSFMYQSLE